MNITYHRVSGNIGFGRNETGTRGAWVEKRVNVLRDLASRHTVTVASRLTKASRLAPEAAPDGVRFTDGSPAPGADLIVLEFGPSNGSWYADDFARTRELVDQHPGEIAYLCDDPDLIDSAIGRWVPQTDWSRWTLLCNCLKPSALRRSATKTAHLGIFNPSVGLPFHPLVPAPLAAFVYSGRPNQRKAQIATMVQSGIVTFTGKPAEWEGLGVEVVPTPLQSARQEFYRRYLASVASFDDVHAQTAWRTGRAYHSLHAGVPVIAFTGNGALQWAYTIETSADLADAFIHVAYNRESLYNQQRQSVYDSSETIFGHPSARALGL